MNPLNTYKKQIGYCSVQTQYVELAIRSMETEFKDELENSNKLKNFANKYGLTLATFNSSMVLKGVAKNYLVNAYTYFDEFLREIINLHRLYCSDFESDRKEKESSLACVLRNMKTTIVDNDMCSLVDLCEYYRFVRNDTAHITNLQDKIDSLYEKLKSNGYPTCSKFGKLNAPNHNSAILFDDFVLFARGSQRLAEYIYSNLKYDHLKITDNIPQNVLDGLRKCSNDMDKCRKKMKKYLDNNFRTDCLKESDFSEMLEIVLRK